MLASDAGKLPVNHQGLREFAKALMIISHLSLFLYHISQE